MKMGWSESTLGEAVSLIRNGLNCKQNKSGEGDRISRIETIAMSDVNIDKVGYAALTDETRNKYKLEVGDILFSHINSAIHVGKTAYIDDEYDLYHGVNLLLLRSSDIVNPRFLEYYLKKLFWSGYWVNRCKRSVNQASVNQKDIRCVPFAYPPLAEQKRIVAILDEALAGISQGVANAEKNRANARELFESYLNSIFSKKSAGWVEKKLGDSNLLQIIDGDRGKNYPKKADFFDDGYCLFLNTKNVRPDGFNFEDTMFISKEKDETLRKGKLQRRDVVLTTRGTIGNIAIYDDSVEYEHMRINSGMLIFRPNERLIKSDYLFEVMRSSIIKMQIDRYKTGAAQPQLPIKTLVNFAIPVPISIKEQGQMVSQLRKLSRLTKNLESIYQQKLFSLAELKQAILQKAFAGELNADIKNHQLEN